MKRISTLVFLIVIQFATAQTVFRGIVMEEGSKTPIPGAQIGITDQGPGELSASNGRFNYRKYHETLGNDSKLVITAPGYKPLTIASDGVRKLFNLSSSIYLEKGDYPEKMPFDAQKDLTIFWDASFTAKERNHERELQLIETYLSNFDALKVRLVAFNDTVILDETMDYKKGTPFALVDKIKNLEYRGATNYDVLKVDDTDAVLLVSDGFPSYGEVAIDRTIPVYSMAAASKVNKKELIAMSSFYQGHFLPLTSLSNTQIIATLKSGDAFDYNAAEKSTANVTGTVTSPSGPIQGATITIKGTFDQYESKANGSFTIPGASEGDIFQVRYLGMYPIDVLVENATNMTITMTPRDEVLDEVILEGKAAEEEADKVDTGYGKKSKDAVGFSVNTISAEDISPGAQYLSDVIRGRFAGVTVSGFGGQSTYQIRGATSINNALPPVWIVDGTLYTDVPAFVDVQNVANISILKGSNATSRYGTVATGGAFIIKTKNFITSGGERAPIVDQALIKGNEYTEQVADLNTDAAIPQYIEQVKQQKGIEAQFKLYERLSEGYRSSAEFFADMALYFQKMDPTKAAQIRARFIDLASSNPKVLRIGAYLYEEAGDYNTAASLYERIAALVPQDSQSYRDLALIYQETGAYDKAFELYINMLGEQIRGVKFTGLEPILTNELLHLLSLHKDKVNYERLPSEWLITNFDLDLRMTLQYSDREAPFEFQFVNPDKKYFKWNHSLFENKERLQQEEKEGFQTEEFVIDDAKSGLWLVNIEYLGLDGQSLIPPYLKYTVYRNYGTKRESKEIKIIKLSASLGKAKLAEFLL